MTFPAQSPDLCRFPLVAGASRSVVRSPRSAAPRIRFLFVDSRVRSTLRSAHASRRTPCASLRSLRPGSGRTFTSKFRGVWGPGWGPKTVSSDQCRPTRPHHGGAGLCELPRLERGEAHRPDPSSEAGDPLSGALTRVVPGAYVRIVREGELGAGDSIRILSTPSHGMTVGDVFRIYSRDRNEIAKLVDIPELSQSWRSWAERKLERKSALWRMYNPR